jgi:hypothetical protein
MSAFDVSVVYRVKNLVSAPLKKIKSGVTNVGEGFKKARRPLDSFALKFKTATAKMRASIRKLNIDIKGIAKGLRTAGLAMTLAITAPVAYMAVGLKNAARDADETRAKFGTVFKAVGTQAEAMADSLAASYGLSNTAARKLLGDTGDLLAGFGFNAADSLDFSNEIQKLAVDLSSFANLQGGAARASEILTKAMLGERDSLIALGIKISEEDVKKQVAIQTAEGLTFATEREAKAMATKTLVIKQSGNAIGDFARTSQGLANQERITSASIVNLKESFGAILMPVALKITQVIGSIARAMEALSPRAKTIIMVVAGVAAVLAPIILLIGTIGVMLPAITAGFAMFGTAMAAAFSPITLIVLGIAAAAYLIISNWDTLKGWFSAFFDFLKNTVAFKVLMLQINAVAYIFTALGSIWRATVSAIADTSAFKGLVSFFDGMLAVISSIGDAVGSVFGAVGKAYSFVNDLAGGFIDSANEAVTGETSALVGSSESEPLAVAAKGKPLTGGGSSQKTEINAPIVIHAAEGMDETKLASEVAKQLGDRERGAAKKVNFALGDMGFN